MSNVYDMSADMCLSKAYDVYAEALTAQKVSVHR